METARLRVPCSLLRILFFSLAILATLAEAFLFSGCAAPAPIAPPASPPAHLIVVNETDYLWHLVIIRPGGGSAYDSQLQPRATVSLDLAGGDYVIEQSAISENAATELTRKIPANLQSGQTYRWRLVTLLSESTPPSDSK